ncbi:MAG: TRAP transporter substrate-binding protein [Alphaproteobacteria bacterium]|nr:TRAP transporter substrate-binding protein [Alphaproteobacteria bacterium]
MKKYNKFKRRDILLGASAITASSLLIACKEDIKGGTPSKPEKSTFISKNIRQLRMATTWPKNFPGVGTTAEKVAETITKASDGRLEIKVYGSGEIVPAYEVFDAVRQGTVEMGHGWPGYWISKNPGLAYFGGIPGGLSPSEQSSWIMHGGGQKLWEEAMEPYGMQPFQAGIVQSEMFGWYKNTLNSLEDLQGLKIRMAGLPNEILNRMGATAVNIPGGEVMSSFQSGVVDAVEWGGPWMDLAFGFPKIAKICYGPGIHSPGSMNEMLMNKELYNNLPNDLKKIIKTSANSANNDSYNEYIYRNAISYQTIVNDHDVEFKTLPMDIMKEFLKVAKEVVQDNAEKNPEAMKIHMHYQDFLKKAIDITKYQESGYLQAREMANNV